jgi:hypothetical protein
MAIAAGTFIPWPALGLWVWQASPKRKHTPTLVAECIDTGSKTSYSVATDPRDFGNFELVGAKRFLSLRLDNIKQLESLTAVQALRGALFLGFVEHLNIFWGEL